MNDVACSHRWKDLFIKINDGIAIATCRRCGLSWDDAHVISKMIWEGLHQRMDEVSGLVMLAEGVQARLDGIDRVVVDLAERVAQLQGSKIAIDLNEPFRRQIKGVIGQAGVGGSRSAASPELASGSIDGRDDQDGVVKPGDGRSTGGAS